MDEVGIDSTNCRRTSAALPWPQTMRSNEYPSDIIVRWSVHPADYGRLAYVQGTEDSCDTAREGETITRPFLVDPLASTAQVPVRVVQVLELFQERPPVLLIVVTRASRA
jgi:hypothetical protein